MLFPSVMGQGNVIYIYDTAEIPDPSAEYTEFSSVAKKTNNSFLLCLWGGTD